MKRQQYRYVRGKPLSLQTLKRIWLQEQGATLMEVVLAVAVFSLLMTAVLTFYCSSLQSWRRNLNTMDIQQNARIAMDEIIWKLRYAHALEGFLEGNILPLYHHGGEEQQGAGKVHFSGLNEDKKLTAYEIKFNESQKSVSLKSGKGPHNEIAYHVEGLEFFRYLPPGVLPGEDVQKVSPMILVVLKTQGTGFSARGAPYTLRGVVRLQNMVLPVE